MTQEFDFSRVDNPTPETKEETIERLKLPPICEGNEYAFQHHKVTRERELMIAKHFMDLGTRVWEVPEDEVLLDILSKLEV